jgi:hypothetical protein
MDTLYFDQYKNRPETIIIPDAQFSVKWIYPNQGEIIMKYGRLRGSYTVNEVYDMLQNTIKKMFLEKRRYGIEEGLFLIDTLSKLKGLRKDRQKGYLEVIF